MPEVTVRLGRKILIVDGYANDGLSEFLDVLRDLVVKAEISSNVRNVELIVSHDGHGLDRNVEAVKIVVATGDSPHNRRYCNKWHVRLVSAITSAMAASSVPEELVPEFQVVISVGGNVIGAVFSRKDERVTRNWVDDTLRPDHDW